MEREQETQGAVATSEEAPTSFSELYEQAATEPADQTTSEDTAGEETAETQEAGAEAETAGIEDGDGGEPLPEEGDTEFSDEFLSKYAAHFSKTFGVELNLEDPVHRALLAENVRRGQRLKEMEQRPDEEPDSTTEDTDKQPEKAEAKTEDFGQMMTTFGQIADEVYDPKVGDMFLREYLSSVYPNDDKGKPRDWSKTDLPPQMAERFTKTMTKFGAMLFRQFMPSILSSSVPVYMDRHYPSLSRIHDNAQRQEAFERISKKHPDFAALQKGGTVTAVLKENSWIGEGEWKDSKTGRVLTGADKHYRQLEIAYSLAKNQKPSADLLAQAAQKGREQAKQAQSKAGLAKLSSGESGRKLTTTSDPAEQWLKSVENADHRRAERLMKKG